MPQKVRIALDAMGGDHGPSVVVPGAAVALAQHPGASFILFGDQAKIEPLLAAHPQLKDACRLVHTDVAVRMEDKPSQALRNGRWKSSMWLAIDAVKKGDADVAVSAGNTGALMAMAKFNLRMLPGIERPAIAGLWPTLKGSCIVLDLGASIGADAESLVAMAVMGTAMSRVLFHLDRPTVGLLNIGVEEAKGLEAVREAGRILREEPLPHMDYVGFRRRRRHRPRQGRRGGDRGLRRQYRAQGGRRHRSPVCRLSALCDLPVDLVEARLSAGAAGVPHAARQDGSA
jgi:glycerol-3-phosphate acyltransferase PlsX